jgi:PhnB protein
MTKAVKPIPDGHHAVTPYLIVKGAASAIEFYKKALGAREMLRVPAPASRIGHAELRFGDSVVMLADEFPDIGARGPQSFGGSPVSIHLYVEDVDAVFRQAIAAGATLVNPVKDQFYGDRMGSFTDPFGHTWHVATHIEDLSPEELQKRAAKAHG